MTSDTGALQVSSQLLKEPITMETGCQF